MQQKLDAVQPGKILIVYHGLVAARVPAMQKSLHRRFEMSVTCIELHVELRKHELIVTDKPARSQQRIAQWRAMPLALNIWMFGKHLAKQRRP